MTDDEKAEQAKEEELKEKIRAELLKERETLNEVERDAAKAVDRALLSLSAGALFLSITFVKEILAKPNLFSRLLLLVAWGFFAVSMFYVLLGGLATQYAVRRKLKDLHVKLNSQSAEDLGPDVAAWWTAERWMSTLAGRGNQPGNRVDQLNARSLVCFLAGVAMLVFSCGVNFLFGATR